MERPESIENLVETKDDNPEDVSTSSSDDLLGGKAPRSKKRQHRRHRRALRPNGNERNVLQLRASLSQEQYLSAPISPDTAPATLMEIETRNLEQKRVPLPQRAGCDQTSPGESNDEMSDDEGDRVTPPVADPPRIPTLLPDPPPPITPPVADPPLIPTLISDSPPPLAPGPVPVEPVIPFLLVPFLLVPVLLVPVLLVLWDL